MASTTGFPCDEELAYPRSISRTELLTVLYFCYHKSHRFRCITTFIDPAFHHTWILISSILNHINMAQLPLSNILSRYLILIIFILAIPNDINAIKSFTLWYRSFVVIIPRNFKVRSRFSTDTLFISTSTSLKLFLWILIRRKYSFMETWLYYSAIEIYLIPGCF